MPLHNKLYPISVYKGYMYFGVGESCFALCITWDTTGLKYWKYFQRNFQLPKRVTPPVVPTSHGNTCGRCKEWLRNVHRQAVDLFLKFLILALAYKKFGSSGCFCEWALFQNVIVYQFIEVIWGESSSENTKMSQLEKLIKKNNLWHRWEPCKM